MKKVIVLVLALISFAVAILGFTKSIGVWDVKYYEKAIGYSSGLYDVYALKVHNELVYEWKVRVA